MEKTVEEQITLLNKAKEKAQEFKDEKIRMESELSSCKKRLEEIKEEVKKKFDVDVEDLAKEIEKLKKENDEILSQIMKLIEN